MGLDSDARGKAFAELKEKNALSVIGGFLAPIVLMAIYGAVPGAVIMGIAGMMGAHDNAAPGFRFNLRTLLIATTLIAVALGLIVAVLRWPAG